MNNRTAWRWTFISASWALTAFFGAVANADTPSATTSVAPAGAALQSEIDTVKSRYRDFFLEPDYPDVGGVLSQQKPDGSWPDVNYEDKSNAAWSPATHLDRLKQMAASYAKESSGFYHSAKMLAGVENGLRFWYAAKPKSSNWWHNDIGQQLQLERILLLLEHDLPPDLMQSGLTYFKDLSKPSKATGENLVWFAGEYLTHGLLTGNEAEIRAAIDVIEDTIVITDQEGIQVDYAFHQHGPQLYNGGYGYGFLQDSTMYASYVAGTRFAFRPDKIALLSAYCLDGCRWMMRGPMFDYGADGRGLSRPASRKPLPQWGRHDEYCAQLAALDPAHQPEFMALQAAMRGTGAPWTLLGNKQFWSSDFMANQTKSLYASVKMNSSRTIGTEIINGENLKGYWLPFGLTYLAPTGREYAGIFPVWDWAHLPGVTSPVVVYPIKNGFRQPNTFVGGVSDGTHGACAMKLDIESPGESLHAHKAWFFFGDDFLALGSGISSTLADPVDTTLNQTLLKGPVVVDGRAVGEGSHELKGVSWVLHNGIGYLFPAKSDVVVNNHTQTGSWQSISSSTSPAPVSEKVFSLWVHHGAKPSAGSYAYQVVGGADRKKLIAYAAKNPIQILANSADLQAARNDVLGISQAIFYAPGQVALKPGLILQADQSCMVQVTEGSGTAKVVLSSPTSGAPVHLTLGSHPVSFDLPSGPMSGSSQSKDVPLP